MLSDVGWLLSSVMALFQKEFTLYGFSFSFWQVFALTCVAGIVGRFLREVFLDD